MSYVTTHLNQIIFKIVYIRSIHLVFQWYDDDDDDKFTPESANTKL